jgi:hypothetical protein
MSGGLIFTDSLTKVGKLKVSQYKVLRFPEKRIKFIMKKVHGDKVHNLYSLY